MRGSLLVHPPTKLDQGVTDFYVDANFAIGTINWQLEFDQGITEYYMAPTLLSDHLSGN